MKLMVLSRRKVFADGTIRSNCLLDERSLQSDCELKKKLTDSFDQKPPNISGDVGVATWFVNQAVTLASTCASTQRPPAIDRYDRINKL